MQESLQQVLVDALWLVGFAATEAGPKHFLPGISEAACTAQSYCAILVARPLADPGSPHDTL